MGGKDSDPRTYYYQYLHCITVMGEVLISCADSDIFIFPGSFVLHILNMINGKRQVD